MDYRLYLTDAGIHIRAAENFQAENDGEAMEIATAILKSASDIFAGVEVWIGTRRVAWVSGLTGAEEPGSNLAGRHPLIDLRVRQEKQLLLQEQLHDSFECVRRSKQLLAATERLRVSLKKKPQECSSSRGRCQI